MLPGKIAEAKSLYAAARRLDPADPVPPRFLGELLRHETGEWAEARSIFNEILSLHADPLSRAVALHGLGKMTIHDGDFKKGLELFDASIGAYPLADLVALGILGGIVYFGAMLILDAATLRQLLMIGKRATSR